MLTKIHNNIPSSNYTLTSQSTNSTYSFTQTLRKIYDSVARAFQSLFYCCFKKPQPISVTPPPIRTVPLPALVPPAPVVIQPEPLPEPLVEPAHAVIQPQPIQPEPLPPPMELEETAYRLGEAITNSLIPFEERHGDSIDDIGHFATMGMLEGEAAARFFQNPALAAQQNRIDASPEESELTATYCEAVHEHNGYRGDDLIHDVPELFSTNLRRWIEDRRPAGNWDIDPQTLASIVHPEFGDIDRPLLAAMEVWNGGNNTPFELRIAGSGALLRAIPVAGHRAMQMLGDPRNIAEIGTKLIQETIQACAITHADPRTVASAVAISVAIAWMIRSGTGTRGPDGRIDVPTVISLSLEIADSILCTQCNQNGVGEATINNWRLQLRSLANLENLGTLDEGYCDAFRALGTAFWTLRKTNERMQEISERMQEVCQFMNRVGVDLDHPELVMRELFDEIMRHGNGSLQRNSAAISNALISLLSVGPFVGAKLVRGSHLSEELNNRVYNVRLEHDSMFTAEPEIEAEQEIEAEPEPEHQDDGNDQA